MEQLNVERTRKDIEDCFGWFILLNKENFIVAKEIISGYERSSIPCRLFTSGRRDSIRNVTALGLFVGEVVLGTTENVVLSDAVVDLRCMERV